tara:strand:- start:914 stop:1297 length:384 start_codon:yes stop_codon:yes gene_type:complete
MPDGTELEFRQVTMAEAIEMDSAIWQRERESLIQMLDDAKATPDQRVEKLEAHYERRGLASEMTRQLFRVGHSMHLLKTVSNETTRQHLDRLAPNQVCEIALRCVGYELKPGGEDTGKGTNQASTPP